MEDSRIEEKAKELRRAYYRQYRAERPEKVKAYHATTWRNKAIKALEAEQFNAPNRPPVGEIATEGNSEVGR